MVDTFPWADFEHTLERAIPDAPGLALWLLQNAPPGTPTRENSRAAIIRLYCMESTLAMDDLLREFATRDLFDPEECRELLFSTVMVYNNPPQYLETLLSLDSWTPDAEALVRAMPGIEVTPTGWVSTRPEICEILIAEILQRTDSTHYLEQIAPGLSAAERQVPE